MKKIVFILLCIFFFMTTSLADTEQYVNENKEALDALKATAYAFYDRGEGLQYDNSSLTFLSSGSSARGVKFLNPEQASIYSKEYTVCSSFVYQTYYNTFENSSGENYRINNEKMGKSDTIAIDTRSEIFGQISNPNADILERQYNKTAGYYTKVFNSDLAVYYIDEFSYYNKGNTNRPAGLPVGEYPTTRYDKTTKKQRYNMDKASILRNDILSVIEPGDVLVYYSRVSGSGHVMLYLGDGITAESQHGSYDGTYNFKFGLDPALANYPDPIENKAANSYNNGNNYYVSIDNRPIEGTIKLYYLYDSARPKDVFRSEGSSVLGSGPKDSNGVRHGYRAFNENITSISIIRPLNEIKKQNYTVNDNSLKRKAYIRLYFEKTANVKRYDSINPNSEITYTITFKNRDSKSHTYHNTKITDEVPAGATITSVSDTNSCRITGQKLSCDIREMPLGPEGSGETKKITYTVKVNSSLEGKYLSSNNTRVNGILVTDIETYVGKTLTPTEEGNLKNIANNLKNNEYSRSMLYIDDIYKNLGGNYQYIKLDSVQKVINEFTILNDNKANAKGKISLTKEGNSDVITTMSYQRKSNGTYSNYSTNAVPIQVKYKPVGEYDIYWLNYNSSYFSQMFIYGLYGGTTTLNNGPVASTSRRITFIEESDLRVGDVIVTANGASRDALIYLGNGTINHISNRKVVSISNIDKFLQSLFAKDFFVILRPSLTKFTTITIQCKDTTGATIPNCGKTITGAVGSKYTISPQNITNYTFKSASNNLTGEFGKTNQTVTLTYEKKKGKVTVFYEDENGNNLLTTGNMIVITDYIGSTYTTERKTFNNYQYVSVSGGSTGQITSTVKEVRYKYRKTPGKIEVNYLDEGGYPLATKRVINGTKGTPFDVTEIIIPHYMMTSYTVSTSTNQNNGKTQRIDSATDSITGVIEEGTTIINITYTYDSSSQNNGSVSAHYIDTNGRTIAADYIAEGPIGSSYSVPDRVINNYTLIEDHSHTGLYTSSPIEITFIYKKKDSTVTARYVDSNGNELLPEVVSNYQYDTEVVITPPSIDGYTVSPSNYSVQTSTLDYNVTFTYTKIQGRVTAKYVNEDGDTISDNQIYNGGIGDVYEISPKEIPGYTYSSTQDASVLGTYLENPSTITFIYKDNSNPNAEDIGEDGLEKGDLLKLENEVDDDTTDNQGNNSSNKNLPINPKTGAFISFGVIAILLLLYLFTKKILKNYKHQLHKL